MMHSKHLKAYALSPVRDFRDFIDFFSIGEYIIFGGRSTVEDGIREQQRYEDTLVGPKYWKVERADEEEFEDAIIKFKTDKKGELLVKVKYADGSSNGWYEGAVNTAGLVEFATGVLGGRWVGNVASDGGYVGFNVGYSDEGVGFLIAEGVW